MASGTNQTDLSRGVAVGSYLELAKILQKKLDNAPTSQGYLKPLDTWYERSIGVIGDGRPNALILIEGAFTARIGSIKPDHGRLFWLLRDQSVTDAEARRAIVQSFAARPNLRTVLCIRPDPGQLGGFIVTDWGVRGHDPLIDELRAQGCEFRPVDPLVLEPRESEAGRGPPARTPRSADFPSQSELPASEMDWFSIKPDEVVNVAGIEGAEEPILRALSALAAGMNVIFVGPPGTGKTTLASAIFSSAGVNFDIRCASDHWTTYDTIGGYFPEPDDEGQSRLVFRPGVLLQAMRQQRCLIIDEINRADIDKAFGELFTLFGSKQPVELKLPFRAAGADGTMHDVVVARNGAAVSVPQGASGLWAEVPASWRLIGTMNDADRVSLKRFSLAFARRFAMVPVQIPTELRYRGLLQERIASERRRLGGVAGETAKRLLELTSATFASPKGLSAMETPLGPGFALVVVDQVLGEVARDPIRSVERAFLSALELYVAPQFQGLATKHHEFVELVKHVSKASHEELAQFERSLVAWTGGAVTF